MPSHRPRTAPTVLLPGWQGSGDGHWQSWLEAQLHDAGRETRRPQFADLDNPELADWLHALTAAISDLPDGYDLIAHSLGAVLWLHHVGRPGHTPRPGRVLLVAPPSPRTELAPIAEFFPPPLDAAAVRSAAGSTTLVAGDDDPYLPEGVAAAYGDPLQLAPTLIAGGGHLNSDAGYGAWPAVLEWCTTGRW